MTIALVSGQTASGTSGSSIALPNNPTPGNLVVVGLVWENNVTPVVTDANGNAYTSIGRLAAQAAVAGFCDIYYLPNAPSNASKTINISGSPSSPAVWAAEFSGVATSSPVDTTATWTGSTSSTAISQPTLTPAGAGELLFCVINPQGTINTVNTPFSVTHAIAGGDGCGYYIDPNSTAQAFAATQTPAGQWAGLMVAFLAGGAAAALVFPFSPPVLP